MSVSSITTPPELEAVQSRPGLVVIFFWADFHAPSQPGGQMDALFTALAATHPSVTFLKVRRASPRRLPGLIARWSSTVTIMAVVLLACAVVAAAAGGGGGG
jgi:hypothetical protein